MHHAKYNCIIYQPFIDHVATVNAAAAARSGARGRGSEVIVADAVEGVVFRQCRLRVFRPFRRRRLCKTAAYSALLLDARFIAPVGVIFVSLLHA